MEKRRNIVNLRWSLLRLLLGILILVDVIETETVNNLAPISQDQEHTDLQQGNIQPEFQKRQLSASEQAQILSDVQQHRSRFGRTHQQTSQNTSPLPNLSKYKVDRVKQQQRQQQQKQQQQQQQQQEPISQQLATQNLFDVASTQTRYNQPLQAAALQSQQRYNNQYNQQRFGNNVEFQNQRLFDNERSVQLQSYFEKQRQLELLQRQRERLLAEQQELRRQQELLRLQQLQQLQSSSTTTTTTTPVPLKTTFAPLLISSPSARRITPDESNLFLKAIVNHQKKFSTSTATTTAMISTSTTTTTTTQPPERQQIPKDILSLIEAQESQSTPSHVHGGKSKPQIQIIYQTEKPTQKSGSKTKSSQTFAAAVQREALLKQLKLALIHSPLDEQPKNLSTRELILPNGKTVQVIQAPNGISQIPLESTEKNTLAPPTTSIKPPNAIFEELTKGVLPPGADFEVLRHKLDGKLEDVGKAPLANDPAKKVTFVVLEEQPDGSYKVQGVKGNTDQKDEGDVESIVERIKSGELKLPPSSAKPAASSTVSNLPLATGGGDSGDSGTWRSFNDSVEVTPTGKDLPTPSVGSSSASDDRYVSAAMTPRKLYHEGSSHAPQRAHFVPTIAPVGEIITQHPSTTPPPSSSVFPEYLMTRAYEKTSSYADFGSRTLSPTPRSVSTTSGANVIYEENFERSTPFNQSLVLTVTPPTTRAYSTSDDLAGILKRQGLYAMAKFLGQSGLDTVLNETGPYTIFAPTDKAFRTLLVQLGGPEKAEQKFRENPRLLSGLLLHHVIPGAFRIDSLQDEMTGVSLAGTQLRVNVYAMHDVEWNDVRVTTINGARIVPDKQNIEIPQGISHAVDRVMFPLPVGDLVQTLKADRERRFTVFLRAIRASGLEETLSGLKTYTIFAPTDTAFMVASASPNGSPPWLDDEENKVAAKAIVSRHVIPSTLYTAGMRYYQQKETLHPQASLHIHKNSGRIKVNNAQVITHNIPATNGVIHAVDSLL